MMLPLEVQASILFAKLAEVSFVSKKRLEDAWTVTKEADKPRFLERVREEINLIETGIYDPVEDPEEFNGC